MKYYLVIIIFLFSSCDLFQEENEEEGICVFYEFRCINGTYIHDYNCWDGVVDTACNGTWNPNQSCEEFCEEKLIEEYTLCNVY